MFINLSNHPLSTWDELQTRDAQQYGKCIDLAFPDVDPEGDECYINKLASDYTRQVCYILQQSEDSIHVVHVMGELNLTYALVCELSKRGITCVASTSNRKIREIAPGKKEIFFSFIRFRKYI